MALARLWVERLPKPIFFPTGEYEIPQVLPAFAGISVFRWDINIWEPTILGLVGAGGIGLHLSASIANLAWTQVSIILLIIIASVVSSEWISAKVRHAII